MFIQYTTELILHTATYCHTSEGEQELEKTIIILNILTSTLKIVTYLAPQKQTTDSISSIDRLTLFANLNNEHNLYVQREQL